MTEPTLLHPDAYEQGCPHARLAALRNEATMSWQDGTHDPNLMNSDIDGGWFVHRYDSVKDVLRDPAVFSSAKGTVTLMDVDEASAAAMANMLIMMDPPAHSRYRKLVAAMFTPRRVAELRPRVEQIAREVIDAIARDGRADAVSDIAAPMPMRVIAELLGIPERAQELFDSSNAMIGAVDTTPEERATGAALAGAQLHALGHELAQEKRGKPDDSLMSAYINGSLEGIDGEQTGCTDQEVGWFLLLMAVAGNETVRTATAHAVRVFADWPAQRDLLRSDFDQHIQGAIDELLRFNAPVRSLRRTTTTATEIDGVAVAADTKVVCNFTAALRDPEVFDSPDIFDITRQAPRTQLAFGYGEHYCLGANLARLQLDVILREIYSRIPDIELTGEIVHQPTPLISGYLSMPVEFTPEVRRLKL